MHCPACAHKRFNVFDNGYPIRRDRFTGSEHVSATSTWHEDEHGIPCESIDREGNPIHPVFDIDEASESLTHCGDCHEEL